MWPGTYTELATYYYTTDMLGRPLQLRDDSNPPQSMWHEVHYPFGESIIEGATTMPVGGGTYVESWKPNFRFPGQFEDEDMRTWDGSTTGRSFIVQNHYREYMPRTGRYNRVDPMSYCTRFSSQGLISIYSYSKSSPINLLDYLGLFWTNFSYCDEMHVDTRYSKRGNCVWLKKAKTSFVELELEITGNDCSENCIIKNWDPTEYYSSTVIDEPQFITYIIHSINCKFAKLSVSDDCKCKDCKMTNNIRESERLINFSETSECPTTPTWP